MKNYNVIFVEGLRRIGKSSQITLLRQELLKDKEIKVLNLDQYFAPNELNRQIDDIRTWCKDNPTGTLLINGSLVYSIVHRDIDAHKYGFSYSEYELPIKNLFNLLREFNILHLLLKADRFGEFKRLMQADNFNHVFSQMFYQGLEFFENSQLNPSFKWTTCYILPDETMLEIFTKIKKLI